MKPVLMGMNNPLSIRPEHALYPHPAGCTGWRLWQLLRMRIPDVTRRQYINAFDRRNLTVGPWDAAAARRSAERFTVSAQGRTVCVLGAEVRRAFDLPEVLVHPVRHRGVTFRQLPHPSGRNRWFNEEANREVAALLLESLYRESISDGTVSADHPEDGNHQSV